MSVFSLVKKGRQQAKELKAKEAEKAKEENAKPPYRHIPTHAAIDALSGAPPSWRHDDRDRIIEQNRRRSVMVTSASTMPRVGSSLSYVSYPSSYANPVVPLPKNYSFSSIPAAWSEKMASTNYSQDYFNHPGIGKGKQPESAPPFPTGIATPMAHSSRESIKSSIVVSTNGNGSSANSSNSDDDLEIQPVKPTPLTPGSKPRPGSSRRNSGDSQQFHRLHPSHQRNLSGSQIHSPERQHPPISRSAHFVAPKPLKPRAISHDMSIPPVPALPALQFEPILVPPASDPVSYASSAASIGVATSTAPSSISSTPIPTNTTTKDMAQKVEIRSKSTEETTIIASAQLPPTQSVQPSQKSPKQRSSKTTRFSEVETYISNDDISSIHERVTTDPSPATTAATIREVNHMMMVVRKASGTASGTASETSPKSHRKLSKNPGARVAKEEKKNRWSFRSNKTPAAVAG